MKPIFSDLFTSPSKLAPMRTWLSFLFLGIFLIPAIAAANTAVTVSSIADLRTYASQSNVTVTMTPGTYAVDGPTADFIHFSGDNSIYDLTGVTLEVDTQELNSHQFVNVILISGDGTTLRGMTLEMVHTSLRGLDAWGNTREWSARRSSVVVRVTGDDTLITDCEITTGGSYPYGREEYPEAGLFGLEPNCYGDAFGKGARPVDGNNNTNRAFIGHNKQSGFLITNGASNVDVVNVTLNMRSYGHGFFMQGGASNITFDGCQVLGEAMVDSDDIIAHPVYQEWGAATYGVPIPADIHISRHEDAFRDYQNRAHNTNGWPFYVENVTIKNCRVERMRTAIACADGAGFLDVSNTEVVACEKGFAVSGVGDTSIVNCRGDAVNGPLIYFQRSVNQPADVEVELTGTTPGKGVWPIALISGNGSNITLTSSASPGVYPEGAYISLSQKWREWRHRPPADIDEEGSNNYAEATTNTTVINQTDQVIMVGPNATGNTLESQGGVIHKSTGTGNSYTGATLVLPFIEVQDTWSSPPNPLDVPWADFDGGGNRRLPTPPYVVYDGHLRVDDLSDVGGNFGPASPVIVQSGGTLEISPGFRLQDGLIEFEGSGKLGFAGGAIHSDGQANNGTRLGTGSSSQNVMTGDAVISVGLPGDSAGHQFLIGPISGTGNLTKIGPGRLAMENGANTFSGSLTVAEGEVQTRPNKAVNDVVIADGATLTQIGNLGLNQASENSTTVDGTLNLNNRGVADSNAFSVNIGTLLGGPSGRITSTSEAALQTVNVTSNAAASLFEGQILGSVALVKTGDAELTLSGNSNYTGTTEIQDGVLNLTGSLQSGNLEVDSAGTLAGTGTFSGALAAIRGTLAPGSDGVGTLRTDSQQWHGGASLELEFADMAGVPGWGWDFLQLGGDLILASDLTPGQPVQITLSGAAANFDASSPGSWKILESPQVSPAFHADLFTVDASALAIDAWVESDQFSISESGGSLYLQYSPTVPYAVWIDRFAVGADAEFGDDADGDGILNGMESALGSDPSAHTAATLTNVSLPVSGQMTFTHPYQEPSPVGDVALHYRWSTDLDTFHPSGHSDGQTTVVFNRQADDPEAGVGTVTATITGTVPDRLFITLEAVKMSP